MKKNNLITLVSILAILSVGYFVYHHLVKQNNFVPYTTINDKCISGVAQKVENIEANMSAYATSSRDIFDQSTEGGQQVNYSFNGRSVLIKQVFFRETGKSEVDYFLEDNTVFFLKYKNTQYLLPISEDSSAKVKNVEIKDFYLDNDQTLCSWYLNQSMQVNNSDAEELVRYLISGL